MWKFRTNLNWPFSINRVLKLKKYSSDHAKSSNAIIFGFCIGFSPPKLMPELLIKQNKLNKNNLNSKALFNFDWKMTTLILSNFNKN